MISRSSSIAVSLCSGGGWIGVGAVNGSDGGTKPGTLAVAAYDMVLPMASIEAEGRG